MQRPRLASRLNPKQEKWIPNTLKVNNQLKKMTRTPRTLKRISFFRIFLLIRHHHQVGLNSHWYSQQRKTRTIVFAGKNPINKAKVRTRILLPPASMALPSEKTKIKTKRTYLILSTTIVSKRATMPISVLKRSQKTSVDIDDLHIGDWG